MSASGAWLRGNGLSPALLDVRNLCGVRSGTLGAVAVTLGMAFNVLLVVATVAMFADVRRCKSS